MRAKDRGVLPWDPSLLWIQKGSGGLCVWDTEFSALTGHLGQ